MGDRLYREHNSAIRHVRCRASGSTGSGNVYRIEPRESGTVFSQHQSGDTGPNIYYLPPIIEYGGGMIFHFLWGGNYTSCQLYTALSAQAAPERDVSMEYFHVGDHSRRLNVSHSSGPQTNRRHSFMSLETGGWALISDEGSSGIGYVQTESQYINWYDLEESSEGRDRTIAPEVFQGPAKTFYARSDESRAEITISGDTTLTPQQAGSIVRTATGLGANPIVTLPPAETGLHFWFITMDTVTTRIQPAAGDYIQQWSSTPGQENGTETTYNNVYCHMQMVAIDDTNWYVTHQIPEFNLI